MDIRHVQEVILIGQVTQMPQVSEYVCGLINFRGHVIPVIDNGAFAASRAMSKWLKRGVKISTDGFTRVPLADVATKFDESTPIVALHLALGEQLHGHALLCIPEQHALRLVDILMSQPTGTATEIGELGNRASRKRATSFPAHLRTVGRRGLISASSRAFRNLFSTSQPRSWRVSCRNRHW